MAAAAELRRRLGPWARPDRPLYAALAAALEDLVARGLLPPGDRLPAQRELADALNVSRGTVVAAYGELVESGVLEARRGSGTRVRPGASPTTGPREAHLAASLHHEHIFSGFLHPERGQDTIDLRGAYWSGADGLPEEAFAAAADDVRRLLATPGYFPLGLPALRRALADDLTADGLPTAPEQVLVTSGAQQAIDLVANVVLGPHDDAVVEELTYPGAIDAMLARQARVHTVPLTDQGVDVELAARTLRAVQPRLTYLVPTCHNPTGTVLPAHQARRLVELAVDHGGVLVDDRTLAATLLAEGPAPPPLAAHVTGARARHVVTVGSLSKSTWGGLRIGFVRGDGPLLDRVARMKAVADLGASVPSQAIATRLLDHREAIRADRRRGLAERCDALAAALASALPEWRWQRPRGGLCLWVRLPGGADSADLAAVAARHGVGIAPGTASSPDRRYADHLRVPYGQPPEVLREAVRRLRGAWEEHRGLTSALDAPTPVV